VDEVSAQAALHPALRDIVGPAVRRAGFKGSRRLWRRCGPAGDWAVVNVQSSSFSTAEQVRCVDYVITKSIPRQKQNAEMFAGWVRTQASLATR
jgi:hypothetical protein